MTNETETTFDEAAWARQRDKERSGAVDHEEILVDELDIFTDDKPKSTPLTLCSHASFLLLILSILFFNSIAGNVDEYENLEKLYIYKLKIYEGEKLSYLRRRLGGAARKVDASDWHPPFEQNFRKIIRKSIRYSN